MGTPPISRQQVPALADLPDDVRARIVEVQEEAGVVPNVFLTLAHRPDAFRALLTCCNECIDWTGPVSRAHRPRLLRQLGANAH